MSYVESDYDIALKELTCIITPMLLEMRGGLAVDPYTCEHRLQVGVNDRQALCVVCRAKLDIDCWFGVRVIGRDLNIGHTITEINRL